MKIYLPIASAAVKEFKRGEKLSLQTPNGDSQLSAFWNESSVFIK